MRQRDHGWWVTVAVLAVGWVGLFLADGPLDGTAALIVMVSALGLLAVATMVALWFGFTKYRRMRKRRVRAGVASRMDVNDLIRDRIFVAEADGRDWVLSWEQLSDLSQVMVQPGEDETKGRVDGRRTPSSPTLYRWIDSGEDPVLLWRAVTAGFCEDDLRGYLNGCREERDAFVWLVALGSPTSSF